MKNAHERFGELVYLRRSEKTRTHIRVHLSAWIGEESKAHLVSVVGGDTEIGALAAAFASHDPFTVIDPDGGEKIVSLGESPTCFRGAINVAGRKRPLKHLVALSQEMIGMPSRIGCCSSVTNRRSSGRLWFCISGFRHCRNGRTGFFQS